MDEDSEDEPPIYAVESDPTYWVNSRHDDEDSEEDNPLDDGEDEEILSDDSDGIFFFSNDITMVGKRKRIPHDSSSEASTDNPQIRVADVIPLSNTVAAVISSINTQGSANGMPFYFECYLY
ncbi:hypothetical protein ACFX2I_000170 [Malus domestica]